MNYFSSNFKLGLLGGGQLGKMLLNETRKLDIYTLVMDPSEDAPCKVGCNAFYQGDLMDYQSVVDFGSLVDVLTIEIENVNVQALETLEEKGVKVYPSSKTLKNIQNKITQKKFYQKHQIPTAPFRPFDTLKDLEKSIESKELKFPFVWKKAQFGYDGFGVKVVKSEMDLKDLPEGSCLAEDMVDFQMELAVIVARNESGSTETFPVVEMEFHPTANQVEYVICPARISSDIAQKAQQAALKVAQAFNHVGLLAVEMFLTKENTIWVNEVAPRTHNSGHSTIEGNYTSQFEQHLRAVLNMPLGNTQVKQPAVMVNLVGAPQHTGPVRYKNMEEVLKLSGVSPHIYGKKEVRPFRKMGHVTIVDPNIEEARKRAEIVKNKLEVVSQVK